MLHLDAPFREQASGTTTSAQRGATALLDGPRADSASRTPSCAPRTLLHGRTRRVDLSKAGAAARKSATRRPLVAAASTTIPVSVPAAPTVARPGRDEARGSNAALDAMWQTYWDDGRIPGGDAEQALVKHYLPFVAQVADRAHHQHFTSDKDDILQDAYAGLIEAVRKWDPSQGREFRRYAPTLIGHRIIDAIRRGSHLPRRRYDRMKQVRDAVAELSQRNGGTPSNAALVAHTGLNEEQIRQAFDDADNRRVMSLDSMPTLEVHDRAANAESDALDNTHDEALHDQMFDSISTLNARQKQVMALYFYENLTLQEIAAVYGVHHTRIHQILTRAQFLVRANMQASLGDD